jgi:hypothetical protein
MKPEKPEVLDADGVPIKVGDELYLTDGFIIKLKCVGFSNDGLVKVTNWGSSEGWVPILVEANELTHKKPDSWEQIEADEKLYCCEYFGRSYKKCLGCQADDPNYHPYDHPYDCNKAKTQDIVRRAKALAGVDDE